MPFEPRLFQPLNAPQGTATEASAQRAPRLDSKSLDLAPELEALAEQLSEDSGHLAQCYPAANPGNDRMSELVARAAQLAEAESVRASSRGASAGVWLARCGLAASLLLALGVWWQNANQVDEPAPIALAAPVVAPVEQPELPSTEPTLAAHESTANDESAPMPMLDPQVFLELDAASQAAVADLVQEGELNQSSLSL